MLLLKQGKLEEASDILNQCAQCIDATKGHALASEILYQEVVFGKNDPSSYNLSELNEKDRLFVSLILQLIKDK